MSFRYQEKKLKKKFNECRINGINLKRLLSSSIGFLRLLTKIFNEIQLSAGIGLWKNFIESRQFHL